ncbi:uncharacterized protein LOC135347939 [Halichondria panicea]|uniref:uncharacterized protein LOC135347939 n=1 Tax=Halichondria panicea TaxID=6063 RepID=UPI00312B8E76
MTQATDYTKLALSDRENTSNEEEHVTFVMEDKESERKEQKSKWTQCKRFAMDTKKRFLNKVQNNLGTVLGLFFLIVMSAVFISLREVHASLEEKNEKANTTQSIEIEALREQTKARFESMQSLNINQSKVIDSLNTTLIEALARISELTKKSELQFTTVNDTIQSGFKELEVSTGENITKASKISSDLFHQLETQVANNATLLEHTVKRVDELKQDKSDTDEEVGKNINELSQRMDTIEQNTEKYRKRFERVDTELENLATRIDSQNSDIESIEVKYESQDKRLDQQGKKVTQIDGKQVSLTEKTNEHDQRLNRLQGQIESVRSSGSRVTGSITWLMMFAYQFIYFNLCWLLKLLIMCTN